LNDGITLVLAGRPNVGKSSLLNRLLGYERAIVSNTPGTTRDVLTETMDLNGIPVRIVDTAGLRESGDAIEQEGVRRARAQIADADRVVVIREDGSAEPVDLLIAEQSLPTDRLSVVNNKIDLTGSAAGLQRHGEFDEWGVSALSGAGIDALVAHLKASVGFRDEEGVFSARRRHVDALTRAKVLLEHGTLALAESGAGELLADDLRVAHDVLGEITGAVSSDQLLGEIFARFCIGK
jgi:tRNA modification GTPase